MWAGIGTDSDAVSAELGLMLTSVTASKCSLTYLNLRNPLRLLRSPLLNNE